MFTADNRRLIEHYRQHPFSNDAELLLFVKALFKGKASEPLSIPQAQVCPEHDSPAQYFCDAVFERTLNAICWANRGGGKTLLGALVTWLDTVFKAGCSTQVLAGSLEQSNRMYEHMTGGGDGWGLVNENFYHLLASAKQMRRGKTDKDGEMLTRSMVLKNFSSINLLTASPKSVRGAHPQKVKLDEIDEMDPRIYEAALSTPMTKGGHQASTHIYSTMHKTYGLMQRVVEEAPARGYRLYKWCVLDVLERCKGRECTGCDLYPECQGRAREADGYYSIENAITKKRQVSEQTWLSEYLCQIPSSEGLIYPEFDMCLVV
jgi:hypothetical protein